MLTKKLIVCACAAVALAGLASAPAVAQTSDQRTFFTFSGPVDIPGVGLQPGKYLFRIVNPTTDSSVVQILSADGTQIYSTFFSRAVQRVTPADEPEIRFIEAPRGAPAAIRAWWSPGYRTGREFVYPKAQARRIAELTHESVLTTRQQTTTAKETNTTDLARVSPGGSETRVDQNELTEGNPSGSAAHGNPAPASIQTPVTRVARARTSLPQTASTWPEIFLTGMLMLAAAIAIRVRRTRIA